MEIALHVRLPWTTHTLDQKLGSFVVVFWNDPHDDRKGIQGWQTLGSQIHYRGLVS